MGAAVSGCCLLAGQTGLLHMEPAPLVSFVFSPMVSTASCTKKREEKQVSPISGHLSANFTTLFFSIYTIFFLTPQSPYPFLVFLICLSCSALHSVLGSAVPSCLFVFFIYPHVSNIEKSFSKLYHER